MPFGLIRIVLASLAALAIVAALAYQYGLFAPGSAGRAGGIARIGGPFALIDQNGEARRATDFRGKLMLIYFGYTNCPDACPTALQIMTVATESLGAEGADVQPILITTDPARDTVSQLKSYAANFHPRLVALTGPAEALAAAARAWRVYSAIPKGERSKTDYLLDHTSAIYLMGRDGGYLTHFTHDTDAERMAAIIRKHL